MDYLKKVIHDYHERRAASDSKPLPTPSCIREGSASEKNAVYQPVGYGLLFCVHGKSYFDVCPGCRRTRREAKEQFRHFEKRYLLVED